MSAPSRVLAVLLALVRVVAHDQRHQVRHEGHTAATATASVTAPGRSPGRERHERRAGLLVALARARVAALQRLRHVRRGRPRRVPAGAALRRLRERASAQPSGGHAARAGCAAAAATAAGSGASRRHPHHGDPLARRPPSPRPRYPGRCRRSRTTAARRPCAAAWRTYSSPAAGRPSFVGVSYTGPTLELVRRRAPSARSSWSGEWVERPTSTSGPTCVAHLLDRLVVLAHVHAVGARRAAPGRAGRSARRARRARRRGAGTGAAASSSSSSPTRACRAAAPCPPRRRAPRRQHGPDVRAQVGDEVEPGTREQLPAIAEAHGLKYRDFR